VAYHASLKLANQDGLLKPKADVGLADLSGVDLRLVGLLKRLEPFGQGNPAPLFQFERLQVLKSRAIGRGRAHCRLLVGDGQGNALEAVIFNAADRPAAGELIKVVAQVQRNDFNGRSSAELNIKQWQRISEVDTSPLM
jgi:single-stranded-DNA-specific exonuclease